MNRSKLFESKNQSQFYKSVMLKKRVKKTHQIDCLQKNQKFNMSISNLKTFSIHKKKFFIFSTTIQTFKFIVFLLTTLYHHHIISFKHSHCSSMLVVVQLNIIYGYPFMTYLSLFNSNLLALFN